MILFLVNFVDSDFPASPNLLDFELLGPSKTDQPLTTEPPDPE